MPPPLVPSIGTVAGKWRRRVEGASEDFELGIRTKGSRWQPAAEAASGSFKTAISAAGIEERYKSGVQKGAQKYARRAIAVGPQRYAQAAPIAEPDFSAGFAPFLQAISGVDLRPKGPRGAATNYERIKPIGDALNKLRLAGGGR